MSRICTKCKEPIPDTEQLEPEKLIAFNLDGILEMFLQLEENEKETISKTIKRIIENLNEQDRRKILIIIPNNAKIHLKI